MSKYRRYTRRAKHQKREGHKKKILFFGSFAILFLIIFVSLILFGNKGNPKHDISEPTSGKTEETHQEQTNKDKQSEVDKEKEENKPKDKNLEPIEETEKEVTLREVHSDDSNVVKAIEGDWDPIGTEQEGPHTTTYEEGSQDRIEIREAVLMVTDLEEDNLVEQWIGRGGEQKVIATVSNLDLTETYRVYLDWIDGEGWQPTRVEELEYYSY